MVLIFFFAQALTGFTVTTTMSFSPGPPVQTVSTFTASPNSVVADGASAVTLTLAARDTYNNIVPGSAVTLAASGGNNVFGATSGSTDANGVFQTTLKSTLAQAQNVTATFGNSNSLSAAVTFQPGAASAATSTLALSPNSQVANNTNTIVAVLTLRDAQGNAIPGVTPVFTASGSSTTISTPSATTASGQSTVTYKSTLAQNENAVVTAGSITLTAPMTFVAGPPTSAASTLVASPNATPGNGSASIALTATARDAQGNPVSGTSVSLAASGGNNTFAAPTGTTAANGTYATTLKSTQMQTETVTATLNGNANATAQVTFTGPASSANSSTVVNPNTQVVGPSNLITATLTLKDSASNPLAGVTPTWTASGVNMTVAQSGNTNASGVATATYSSTKAQSQNVLVSAGGLSYVVPTTFVAGSPNATQSTIYAMPNRQLANNSNTIVVTATLADSYKNPYAGQTVTFSASSSSNTTVSGAVTSSAGGVAQGTFQSNVVQNENALATAGGQTFSVPIIFTDIPTQCTLTANPNSQSADGNAAIALVATFTNASAAAVPNLMTTFSASGSASTFSPPKAVTNGQGQATSSLKSVYASQNRLIAQAGNVKCSTQGNFTTKTAFCTGSPNFTLTTYNVGSGPLGVALGDINQDGVVDLVVGNSGANTATILLGTGGGAFSAGQVLSTGSGPRVPAIADLNGDGNADIAVANNGDSTVSVFLSNGGGSFQAPVTYAVGNSPYTVMLADMNLDGILDLVTPNGGSSTVSVLLGTGLGTFQAQQSYATDSGPNFGAIGDFNQDGKPDVTTANYAANTVSVLMGTGTGALMTATNYTADTGPTGVSAGDFNGDGNQDIVVTTRTDSYIDLFLGNGGGTFAAKTTYAVTGNPQFPLFTDVNGDGIQDVVATSENSSNISISIGKGDGTLQASTNLSVGSTTKHGATADLNNDGKRDLIIVVNGNNTIAILINAGCN
jgi:hypothetical protein